MPTVRPYFAPSIPAPAKPAVPDQVRAAQRAFFQAALTAAPAAQTAASVAREPQPVQAIRQPDSARPNESDGATERIPRPGSLIDIRV